MFEVMLMLGTIGLGLILASELEDGMKKQAQVNETTSEQINRLEGKVDEILGQIKELKEKNENSGGQTH